MSREEAETTMATTTLQERCARLLWPEAWFKTLGVTAHGSCRKCVQEVPYGRHHRKHDRMALYVYSPTREYMGWMRVPPIGEDSEAGWAACRVLVEALVKWGWTWKCESVFATHGAAVLTGVRGEEHWAFAASLPDALATAFCEAVEAREERAEGATP